jgi:Kdo2-lipid IVA lauroyltransferase/acyltransferase
VPLGALYRPMSNARFNEHYAAAMADADAPIFPATRRGLVEMIRFLARGNTLGVLTDIYVSGGATRSPSSASPRRPRPPSRNGR